MAKIEWIPKNEFLPPCDMGCYVLNESYDEIWEAWYDKDYQAFFHPDYYIPIEISHWKPRLKVS